MEFCLRAYTSNNETNKMELGVSSMDHKTLLASFHYLLVITIIYLGYATRCGVVS